MLFVFVSICMFFVCSSHSHSQLSYSVVLVGESESKLFWGDSVSPTGRQAGLTGTTCDITRTAAGDDLSVVVVETVVQFEELEVLLCVHAN